MEAQARSAGLVVHHSDREACTIYGALVRQEVGGGRDNPFDGKGRIGPGQSAISEGFVSTLKCELVHRHRFPTPEAARIAVFEYLEAFYDRRRLHPSLGYMSPESYEELKTKEVAVA